MARSRSPLSSKMGSRFGGRKNRRNKQIGAGITALLAVTYFGSTLAANVSLGTGALEFGQGSRAAVACDTDGITTAINESWNNTLTQFDVATVVLSGIDTSACAAKIFKVTLLGNSGSEMQLGNLNAHTFASVTVSDSDGSLTVTSAAGTTGLTASKSGTSPAGIITLTLDRTGTQDTDANYLNAADIFRINLESNES